MTQQFEIDEIVLIKPLVTTGIVESVLEIDGQFFYYIFIESSRFLERYPENALEKGEIKDASKLSVPEADPPLAGMCL